MDYTKLKYGKKPERKKRKKHKPSIMDVKDGRCYLCELLYGDFSIKYTEEHHCFDGPRRGAAEAEGLKVYL